MVIRKVTMSYNLLEKLEGKCMGDPATCFTLSDALIESHYMSGQDICADCRFNARRAGTLHVPMPPVLTPAETVIRDAIIDRN